MVEAGLHYIIETTTLEKYFNDINTKLILQKLILQFLVEIDLCNLFFNV